MLQRLRRSSNRLQKRLATVTAHPLVKGQERAAIRRYLGVQLRHALFDRPVIYPFVNDVRFQAQPKLGSIIHNHYVGLYDFEEMCFVAHFLRPADCFVDVGANVGAYTLLAAGVAQATTFAFEPAPQIFAALQANVALNSLQTQVRLCNFGLGAQADELPFVEVRAGNMSHVSPNANGPTGGRTIKIKPLTAVLDDQMHPVLVKMDVEGYEHAVLQGMRSILDGPTLRGIIIELNGSGQRYGVADAEIDALLVAHGFTPCLYDPFARQVVPHTGRRDQFNVIYLRDLAMVRSRVADAPKLTIPTIGLSI